MEIGLDVGLSNQGEESKVTENNDNENFKRNMESEFVSDS